MVRHFVFVVMIGMLGACSSMPSPEGKPLPELGFAHLKALDLQVKNREIAVKPTDNKAGFTQNLDEMVEMYLNRKLNPDGEADKIVASLDSSSIILIEENSPNAATDFFGLGGVDIYDVKMALRLEHHNDAGELIYGTVVNAHRAIKITEHASIAERERVQFEGLEQLFLMLDGHVNKVLIQDMKLNDRYIVGSQ